MRGENKNLSVKLPENGLSNAKEDQKMIMMMTEDWAN
jgi:hypothetical protein